MKTKILLLIIFGFFSLNAFPQQIIEFNFDNVEDFSGMWMNGDCAAGGAQFSQNFDSAQQPSVSSKGFLNFLWNEAYNETNPHYWMFDFTIDTFAKGADWTPYAHGAYLTFMLNTNDGDSVLIGTEWDNIAGTKFGDFQPRSFKTGGKWQMFNISLADVNWQNWTGNGDKLNLTISPERIKLGLCTSNYKPVGKINLSIDNIGIRGPDSLLVDAGANKTIVCGGNVQLLASVVYLGSGKLTYLWTPAEGLSATDIPDPIANLTSTKTYTVTVTSPDLGVVKDSVKVTVNPLTVNAGADKSIICGGKVRFGKPVTNYTGTGILGYSWLPAEGLDNANIAQPTAEITTDKTYTLTLSTPNGCIATDTVKVTVNPLTATANDLFEPCGNSFQLNVTTNYSGTGALTYEWSPSTGLSATDISNPVATVKTPTEYSVEVTTQNGCPATDNATVTPTVVNFTPSICMVTVNDSDKNVVIWQKGQSTAIDSFYIYRESLFQTDVYDLLGKTTFSEPSAFTDTLSNALIQSNKYRIAVKDSCGFFTVQSDPHKTMHLTINKGQGNSWNLIWETYEGFNVSSYKIYRGGSRSTMSIIGSTAGNANTYSDFNAPDGDVYYQIEVLAPYSCNTLKSDVYSSSRSNIATNAATPSKANNNFLKLYPVPVKDDLYFNSNLSENNVINIFSIDGRKIMSVKQTNTENKINVSSLSEGIYILKLSGDNGTVMQKFIKE